MKRLALLIVVAVATLACDSSQAEGPTSAQSATESPSPAAPTTAQERQRVQVKVTGSGYEPGTIRARAGEPLTLVFTRTTDEGCADKVVFPNHGIRRDLPLNQEVEVELTAPDNETIAFTCGMGMLKGSIVASAN